MYNVEDNIYEVVKTLCTFDSVYVAKCLRNNWFNYKDPEKIFRYPRFNDFVNLFSKIYNTECGFLIKTAPNVACINYSRCETPY